MHPDTRTRRRHLLISGTDLRTQARGTMRRTAAAAMALVTSAGRHLATMANDGAHPEPASREPAGR